MNETPDMLDWQQEFEEFQPAVAEFWDLLLNNICVVGGWIFLSHLWGSGLLWSIYSITLSRHLRNIIKNRK
nr:hypothetical protein [Allocoleopsis franciscana]